MKTIKIAGIILFIFLTTLSCQNNKKDLLEVTIVDNNELEKITYFPNLKFEEVTDSAQFLYNEEDYYRLMTSEIKVAPPIFQNGIITVRVFTRSAYVNNKYEHGFLVRTYSKDNKIKDEMVLASTIGGLRCEGKVTSDLKIIKSCTGGEEVVAQIESDGSIKKITYE